MGRLARSLTLALVLVLCGGMLHGPLGAGRSTAWASVEGWVLHYAVYDRELQPRDWKVKLPNEQSFSQAVQDWAQQHTIQFNDQGWIDAPRFIRLNPGGSAGAFIEGTEFNSYNILLIGVTAEEREALIAHLAPLPGVAPPEISDYTEYYILAGTPKAQVPQRVLINGTAYAFPREFSLEEVNALQQYFQYGGKYTYYVAFPELSQRTTATQDRLKLGDVVRIELDPEGDLVLTTLAEVWDEGRVLQNDPLFQERIGNRGQGSWSVAMSRNLPEPGYDPLQALAARRDRRTEQAHTLDYPLRTKYTYQLFTAVRMLSAGAPKYTAEEAQQAIAWVAQLDASLDAFQLGHPQYWNKLQHRYRVQHGCSYFGAMPLQYEVSVAASDTTLAQEVQAVLAAVPGLPAPQVTLRDLREIYKERQQQVAPPFTGDTFDLPPLPPPDPDRWHELQGYRLEFTVLARAEGGLPIYDDTSAARAFSHALAVWATDNGLRVNPQPEVAAQQPELGPSGAPLSGPKAKRLLQLRFPTAAIYMPDTGSIATFEGYIEGWHEIYLAGVDQVLADSLSAALAALPGVLRRGGEPFSAYMHDSHPGIMVTGQDLVLDGKRYRFPGDFAWEEAIGMYSLTASGGAPRFRAFPELSWGGRDHIKFPDVVRQEVLPDGTLQLTSVLGEWPEGRALRAAGTTPERRPGAWLELPAGEDAKRFDPLPELARQLAQPAPDYPQLAVTDLWYSLAAEQDWATEYAAGADTPAARARQAIAAAVSAKLTPWLEAHPELIVPGAAWPWAGSSSFPSAGSALGLHVYLTTTDAELVRAVRQLLADIPGLPEPVQTQEPAAR